MPPVRWLLTLIALHMHLGHGAESWVQSCKAVLHDSVAAPNMTAPCMAGFYAHYTAVGRVPNHLPAACVAQAFVYHHQFCNPCTSMNTVGIPGSGHLVPTGLGSRWHFITRELERAIAEGKLLRIWDPLASGAVGCPYLRAGFCRYASERCFFTPVDGCPQVQTWAHKDKPQAMASWVPGKTLRRAQLPEPVQRMTGLWFSGQLFYYTLQPLPIVTEWAWDFWRPSSPIRVSVPPRPESANGPPASYIAIHVRWGDKCFWKVHDPATGTIQRKGMGREAECVAFSEYMKHAEQLRRLHDVKDILLSTESPLAIEEVSPPSSPYPVPP